MSTFVMPSLGADMESGVLVEQLIAPGEHVRRGEPIGAVETQKGVIEMESFEDGILDHWLVDIGKRVPVGTPLAIIRGAGEVAAQRPPDLPPPEPPEPTPPEEPAPAEPQPEPGKPEYEPPHDPAPSPPGPDIPPTPELPEVEIPPPETLRPRASPAARRLAAELGIDLSQIHAQPDGSIRRADVEEAAATAAPKPHATKVADMRAAIAAAMSRSKREIPHYYLSHQADLTAADAFLRDANTNLSPEERLLEVALFAKSIAKSLAKFTEFNGHYQNGAFIPRRQVNLGLAIHLREGGLVAPALFDVETAPLHKVMSDIRDLVARVRAGRFRARELTDATITLTSLGDRGVDGLYGVIYPPQVAIVGIGAPRLMPMVHDGGVSARLCATVTLAADHRVSDGHRGALFLRAIAKNLQHPESLFS